ncbi:hypothetical protein [Georgenia sp. AZ-5]|uniref:hypothetical protein n=1 Tax=Georgenia sp. AZ-5 TaxID=3367526 RepID=UPI0037551CD8
MTQQPEHDHATPPYPVGGRRQGQPAQPLASAKTNTMAIVGLICAFRAWPLGIIFSAIGLRQVKQRGEAAGGWRWPASSSPSSPA